MMLPCLAFQSIRGGGDCLENVAFAPCASFICVTRAVLSKVDMLVPVDGTECTYVQWALASANRRASPVELHLPRCDHSNELL